MIRRCALLAIVVAACQGGGSSSPPPQPVPDAVGTGSGSGGLGGSASGSDSGSGADAGSDTGPDVEPSADAMIDQLGAVPAWQAVVDRDRYLLRRKQHGVVYGTVGAAITIAGDTGDQATGKVWLIDDTDGNGALAIRVAWPATVTPPAEGDRVAVGGAWALDDERLWYWQADLVQPLAPAPPSTIPEPRSPPGHVVGAGDPPSGWKPIAVAKDDSIVSFQIVGTPPVDEGDGWKIANELGDEPVAILFLPGERPSYGGHDMRTADEKWKLKRGVDYWVRIGKIRRRDPDKLPTINARTPPVRW